MVLANRSFFVDFIQRVMPGQSFFIVFLKKEKDEKEYCRKESHMILLIKMIGGVLMEFYMRLPAKALRMFFIEIKRNLDRGINIDLMKKELILIHEAARARDINLFVLGSARRKCGC